MSDITTAQGPVEAVNRPMAGARVDVTERPAWSLGGAGAFLAALVALASTWLLALPLCALAPSAELRYLGWPCVASLLAAAAAFMPRADRLEPKSGKEIP